MAREDVGVQEAPAPEQGASVSTLPGTRRRTFFGRRGSIRRMVLFFAVFTTLVPSLITGMLVIAAEQGGFAVTGDLVRWGALAGLALALGFEADLVLITALHEAGHLVVGRLLGFRFKALHVGNLTLLRRRNGLRSIWSEKTAIAVELRATNGRFVRGRFVCVLAGGPLANLVTAALCVPFVLAVWPPHVTVEDIGKLLFLFVVGELGLMSLMSGIGNTIPFRAPKNPAQMSDGARIVSTLRRGPLYSRVLALMGLDELRRMGVRPREWPASLVGSALDGENNPVLEMAATQYAYSWALDRGDVEGAGQFLNRALAQREVVELALKSRTLDVDGPLARLKERAPLMPFEAAYFSARYRADVTTAREWLNREVDHPVDHPLASFLRPRAEAAILLAEGRPGEALAACKVGLAALSTSLDAVDAHGFDATIESEDLRTMAGEAQHATAIQLA